MSTLVSDIDLSDMGVHDVISAVKSVLRRKASAPKIQPCPSSVL